MGSECRGLTCSPHSRTSSPPLSLICQAKEMVWSCLPENLAWEAGPHPARRVESAFLEGHSVLQKLQTDPQASSTTRRWAQLCGDIRDEVERGAYRVFFRLSASWLRPCTLCPTTIGYIHNTVSYHQKNYSECVALKGIQKRLGAGSVRDGISLLRLFPQNFSMPLPGVQMTSIKVRHSSTRDLGLWLGEE